MANRYWVGGTANWDNTAGTKWALTSGGAGGQAVPTASDDVFLDGVSGAVTVTITSTGANCRHLNCTGFTGTLAISNTLTIAGSLTFVSTMTVSGSSGVTFSTSLANQTITSAGKTLAGVIDFNGTGDWTLQDDFTSTSVAGTGLTKGTLKLNGKTLTVYKFSTGGIQTRAMTSSGATFNITGNATTVLSCTSVGNTFTISDSLVARLTYSGSTGTRTVTGSSTSVGALSVSVVAGSDTVSVGSTVVSLDFTGFSGTWTGLATLFGNLKLSPSMTASVTPTMADSTGTKTITTNGKVLTGLSFTGANGTGTGTWQLQDDLSLGTGNITFLSSVAGTLDANVYNVTLGSFSGGGLGGVSLGTGTWSLSGSWTAPATVTPGTSTIKMTTTVFPQFAGASKTYYKLWLSGGFPAVRGSNTFNEILLTASDVTFDDGSTTTVTNFSTSGAMSYILSQGTYFNLVKAGGGTVRVDNLTILGSHASPSDTWYANATSVDGGGNTGWYFLTSAPADPTVLSMCSKGQLVRVSTTFLTNTQFGYALVDPSTVTFKYKDPSGTITTLVYGVDNALVKSSTGKYYVDINTTAQGKWAYRFESTGTGQAANEGSFYAQAGL